ERDRAGEIPLLVLLVPLGVEVALARLALAGASAGTEQEQRKQDRDRPGHGRRHCSTMLNSVRRFSARPAALELDATGWVSPKPTASRRPGSTPSLISAAITASARPWESLRLVVSLPTESVWPSTRSFLMPGWSRRTCATSVMIVKLS